MGTPRPCCGCVPNCDCWSCPKCIAQFVIDEATVSGNGCCEAMDGTYIVDPSYFCDHTWELAKPYTYSPTGGRLECNPGSPFTSYYFHCNYGETASSGDLTDYIIVCDSKSEIWDTTNCGGTQNSYDNWALVLEYCSIRLQIMDVSGVPTVRFTVRHNYGERHSGGGGLTCDPIRGKIWEIVDVFELSVTDCSTVNGATVTHLSRTMTYNGLYGGTEDPRDNSTTVYWGPQDTTYGTTHLKYSYTFCNPITITLTTT